MNKPVSILLTLLVIGCVAGSTVRGAERADVIVDPSGRGMFTTIQGALDALPPDGTAPVVVLLRNGVYNEQVFIRRSRLTLVGENRDSTRIVAAVLREDWNREHNGSDWGAGVLNIDTGTTDVTLANLTVYNNHGSLYGTNRKHQFAIRGFGTRIMLLHCRVVSDGGDALSLWNKTDGMYYHADCSFEGWVDYVCPRGWCYITNSRFFGHNTPSASIWHDGSANRDQKFVITDSYFDGVPGFPLGRNHLDAQIYLVNCRFSRTMANRPFYRPPSSPREWQWGDRHYFFNCRRDSGDYSWFRDNLEQAQGSPRPEDITAKWTFGGRWDPEASLPSVLPFASFGQPGHSASGIDPVCQLRWVGGRNATSHRVYFGKDNPPEFKGNLEYASFDPGELEANTVYFWRIDEVTDDGIIPGETWTFRTK